MNYKDFNDQEILDYISENQEYEDILFKKYEPIIKNYAKKYYPYIKNSGIEMSDLIQEGMLALSNAIRQFNATKNTTFYTFACNCIERRIINVVANSKRLKHKALNESVSFELSSSDDDSFSLENLFFDESENPEFMLTFKEQEEELIEQIKQSLTDFENQVFDLKYNGFEYKEIASILDKNIKAIDNALQRIKTKIKKIIQNFQK